MRRVSLDDWTVGIEERRNERRTRVLLPANIHVLGGDIACSIRDLSDGGARLHVRLHAQVPERFELTVDGDGRRFSCEVRQRSGTSVNVQFLQAAETRILRVAL